MLRVLGQVQPDAQPQLVEAVRRRIESGQWDRDD
jgi:hypothetical protein